jgi:hypothetical protein
MITCLIDPQRRLVLLAGSETLTAAEVLDVQRRLRADPAFDPTYKLLADYRAVQDSDFTPENMRVIAANVPFDKRSRRAFVAPGRLGFGLARMFQAISGAATPDGPIQVFRTIEAAEAWLTEPIA